MVICFVLSRRSTKKADKDKVRLLVVDPLDLAANVATDQPVPVEELDVTCAVASVLSHAGHLRSVVTNDP